MKLSLLALCMTATTKVIKFSLFALCLAATTEVIKLSLLALCLAATTEVFVKPIQSNHKLQNFQRVPEF